jgi:cytochrome d ubiquinol oxidase subunit I
VALTAGALAAPTQIVVGDWIARQVAKDQPTKLAAFEGLGESERGAAIHLGGWYDEQTGKVKYGIPLPWMLSLLAEHDPNARIQGLNDVPEEDQPPVNLVRITFQTMVAIGTFLALLGAIHLYRLARRRGYPTSPWFFRAVIAAGPLAVIALIAGWVTTEVGRQPWVVYGVMRTEDAVTGASGIPVGYAALVAVYSGLIAVTVWMLRRLARAPLEEEVADEPR